MSANSYLIFSLAIALFACDDPKCDEPRELVSDYIRADNARAYQVVTEHESCFDDATRQQAAEIFFDSFMSTLEYVSEREKRDKEERDVLRDVEKVLNQEPSLNTAKNRSWFCLVRQKIMKKYELDDVSPSLP